MIQTIGSVIIAYYQEKNKVKHLKYSRSQKMKKVWQNEEYRQAMATKIRIGKRKEKDGKVGKRV